MLRRLKELRHVIKVVSGRSGTYKQPIHISVVVVLVPKHATLCARTEDSKQMTALILVIPTLVRQPNYVSVPPTGSPDPGLVQLWPVPYYHLRVQNLESQFSPLKNGFYI